MISKEHIPEPKIYPLIPLVLCWLKSLLLGIDRTFLVLQKCLGKNKILETDFFLFFIYFLLQAPLAAAAEKQRLVLLSTSVKSFFVSHMRNDSFFK